MKKFLSNNNDMRSWGEQSQTPTTPTGEQSQIQSQSNTSTTSRLSKFLTGSSSLKTQQQQQQQQDVIVEKIIDEKGPDENGVITRTIIKTVNGKKMKIIKKVKKVKKLVKFHPKIEERKDWEFYQNVPTGNHKQAQTTVHFRVAKQQADQGLVPIISKIKEKFKFETKASLYKITKESVHVSSRDHKKRYKSSYGDEEEFTLKVQNLPESLDEKLLRLLMSDTLPVHPIKKTCQSITRVFIARTHDEERKSRGFGFVTFTNKEHAEMALKKNDRRSVDHLLIHVDWA